MSGTDNFSDYIGRPMRYRALQPVYYLWIVNVCVMIGIGVAILWQSTPRTLSEAEFSLAAPSGLMRRNGFPVPGFNAQDLKGQVTVVNVWASWCPSCRAEHDDLMSLAGQGTFRLVGIASRDKESDTLAYLQGHGNPYAAVGMDPDGRVGRGLFGARGVPTTFVVDREGKVVARFPGALDRDRIRTELMPAIRKASAN
jgi:cytochrome c biogenesis protein CcmG/thiol:disulfide interchange protein DsbE